MDYTSAAYRDGHTILTGVRHFDLGAILDCGQCFQWEQRGEGCYAGVALGRALVVEQKEDRVLLRDTTLREFQEVWRGYFDLDRDYGEVKAILETDEAMAAAVAFCPGMRVLRQDPWEALCSFIISQNNNIPRIKGIVERLCRAFGDPLPGGSFAFPPPRRLAERTVEDLAELRSGFRAKYILDAARLTASGELELEPLYTMELDKARGSLMAIKGVGPKVAECALLYGFGRAECVPVDVWIKRALAQLYLEGFPPAFSPIAGIGQQYLFHYMRKGRGA